MDSTSLFVSILFGMIGTGMLMYGKNTGRLVPIISGLLLMICPYFIPGVLAMVIVCTLVTAAPMVMRHA